MKIRVELNIKNEWKTEDWIEIDDRKLEGLSEEEIENAVEVMVRSWANDAIRIEWETSED